MTTTLSLSEDEREILRQILDQDLRELQNEINHTDDHAFKAHLQKRERTLGGVVARLGGGAAQTPGGGA